MSRFNPLTDSRRRRSIRLRGYDYSQAGAYFVTVRLASDAWQWLGTQYPYVLLDEFVVMPNHLHGILMIIDDARRGGSRTAPTGADSPDGKRKPLGRLLGAFKTVSTKRVNCAHGLSGRPLWQRNNFEHVVRSEESLTEIRQYIHDNPARWEFDKENPRVVQQASEGQ